MPERRAAGGARRYNHGVADLRVTYVQLQTRLFSDERVAPDERERIDTRCALIAAAGGVCAAAAGMASMLVAAVVGAAIGTVFGPLATMGFSVVAAGWGVWGGAAGGWWLTRRVQTSYLRAALARSCRPLLEGGSGGVASPAAIPLALLSSPG